jgi:hypothetical protein
MRNKIMRGGEKDKQVVGIIAQIFVAIIFIAVPSIVIGHYVSGAMPVIFIVAGLLVFAIPGLFHPDSGQPKTALAALAHRCYQLIEDEDPKTPGKISLAKFQMLFWTIILATSFTWLLLNKNEAPKIPNEWLILMGVSNGTYVLAKWAKTVKEGRGESEKKDEKQNPGEK